MFLKMKVKVPQEFCVSRRSLLPRRGTEESRGPTTTPLVAGLTSCFPDPSFSREPFRKFGSGPCVGFTLGRGYLFSVLAFSVRVLRAARQVRRSGASPRPRSRAASAAGRAREPGREGDVTPPPGRVPAPAREADATAAGSARAGVDNMAQHHRRHSGWEMTG